jgi:hypothetical protein
MSWRASEAYSELQIGCAGSDNRHEVTDVLTDHEGDWHPIGAAFQTHLKRRLFLDPYRLRVTESEPKTHNKRLKGDTFPSGPGAGPGCAIRRCRTPVAPVSDMLTLQVAENRFKELLRYLNTEATPKYQRLDDLTAAGFVIIGITNQSSIGRNLISLQ